MKKDMKIKYKKLKLLVVLYAVIPMIIFFFGWLNIISRIVFIGLSIVAVYFFIRSNSDSDGKFASITLSRQHIIIIAVISFVWCFMAGQGSFVHQSSDHIIRNAILRDLIAKKWPVTYDDGTSLMSYYIAHWMLPAAIGKLILLITGSTFAGYLAGNIALLLWSSFGCFIILMLVAMITNTGKKQRIFIAIALFMFFSGLDIVGVLIKKNINAINASMHLEWWAGWFQYSSNMTCLYWVYNQTIVPWMILLCLMNEKTLKHAALIAVLAFPYGPFPFVGLVILCFLRFFDELYKSIRKKHVPDFLKTVFTPQNIIGLVAVAPVYMLYYTANAMVAGQMNNSGVRVLDAAVVAFSSDPSIPLMDFIRFYVLFIVLEAGVYMALILSRVKPNVPLIGMGVSLLFIPYIQIGQGTDFTMRASIPALVYICVTFIQVIMKELPRWGEYGSFSNCMKHKKFLIVALTIFMIGAVTPCLEIKREFLRTIITPYNQIMDYYTKESLQDLSKGNFVAQSYQDSNFYKYFCKK